MKELSKLTIIELKDLMSEIKKEIEKRESNVYQTTCVWGMVGVDNKSEKKENKSWEGEKYIS